MDAVILAGGKGSRLNGVVPPYWKPLTLVNQRPLICHIYDQAASCGEVDNVFVVVAPENALPVSQIMGRRRPYMVVQRSAVGPGDALRLALALTRADAVLVLMGDNLMPDSDVHACVRAGADNPYVIGTGVVDTVQQAARFTRVYSDGRDVEEGPNVSWPSRPPFTVWCGPLVLPVNDARRALDIGVGDDETEQKIGTHLRHLRCDPVLVPCSAVDIGTPETIAEVQA